MKSIEELSVFKKAHLVTLEIYKVTKGFPKTELFSLSNQMQRAAISINSNLAEGGARNSSKELKYFISIARGSLAELSYQLLLAKDLDYLSHETFCKLETDLNEIGRMLTGLLKSLNTNH